MSFKALGSSIPRFQLSLYPPAPAEPLPLHLQLAFLPQRSLSQHNPGSILLSLRGSRSAFLVVSRPQDSFWIASCAMPHGHGLSRLPRRSCLHSLDAVAVWSTFAIFHICLPGVAKSSFSEHWPWLFALTLLVGEMLDVPRYGQYGGKFRLLSQGWHVYSSWTKQKLVFDSQWNGNS